MRNTITSFKGNMLPVSLVASAIVGFVAVMGLLITPLAIAPQTDMRIEPQQQTLIKGETFTVEVIVESAIPVNVFAGELFFDTEVLGVTAIDYNTSIADLWAEKPWYSNGDGTLSFAGGTTQSGGFTGTDTLITITFEAKSEGAGKLNIKDALILQHDGLGTEAPLVASIDALFIVSPTASTTASVNLLEKQLVESSIRVVKELPSTDLNNDGSQTIADISIMLMNFGSTDLRFDLNVDGKVDLKDFNIILTAK